LQGKRHDLTEDDDELGPGKYGKHWLDGNWYCNPPDTDLLGSLANHVVVENEDGTITVTPSILIRDWRGNEWHGYIENGVWRKV